ncbi:MAG: hypothetical protein KatS3mg131_2208 [Candidatus Tectimicrobiota bacterium]|nr:MAG: hypothetical protein KatS3mg131_2208 [Candidatus Tectomicrobia bacterium]
MVATLVHLLQTHRITYWGHPGVFETWRDEAAQHALPEFA